ncbi:MAG: hypothetical protein ACYC2U_02095 [Candidatus Amoebophilus sp.]
MRYAKIKTRKTIMFSYAPIFALLTLIVCMSCGGKSNIEKKPKIISNQQKDIDRTDTPVTDGASKRINEQWVCITCNYISEKPNNVCPNCKEGRQQLATTLQQSKVGLGVKKKTQSSLDLSADVAEDCPICFEEDAVKVNGAHMCEQCKKAICVPCYKQMQDINKHFCPLCRYGFDVD